MNMNKRPQNALNLITDLPENVIDGILMCLPLKQAGKTSVLSTRWKYKWAKLPHLIFDDTYFPGSSSGYRARIISIYEVLLLHHTPIRKFSLAFSGLRSCPEINKLLQFVFRNGVEDLTLKISDGDSHRLPEGIFSCQQLKHLQLHACELRPSMAWKGFPKLISLELYKVNFVDDSIHTFITLCPELEVLKLLNVSSSSPLDLDIHAPNLRHVHIEGEFKTVSFKDAHKLVNASFKVSTTKKVSSIEEFFSGLLPIQSLTMDSLQQFSIAEVDLMKPPTILYSLKHLHLGHLRFCLPPDISCSLWLIRNAPGLKSIGVESAASSDDDTQAVVLLKAEESDDVSLNHLQEVNMKKVLGKGAELEFIKYLLAKSPNLKKYYIAPAEAVGVQGKLDMLAKITEFQRASPRAEIKFILSKTASSTIHVAQGSYGYSYNGYRN